MPQAGGRPPAAPPPSARADRAHHGRGPLVAALVIGLVIGAGVVGGVWWTNRGSAGALPTPIPISLDTLPSTVLGQQRDDLAMGKIDSPQAKQNAASQAKLLTDRIAAYQNAYGGKGIQASYGSIQGKQIYQLLIVNGMQPAPLVTPDPVIDYLKALNPTDGIRTSGTTTTRCVVSPSAGLPISADMTVAQARAKVLKDPASTVTCVRSDRQRNLSVQLWGHSLQDGGPAASQRAVTMAGAVDKIWDSLTG